MKFLKSRDGGKEFYEIFKDFEKKRVLQIQFQNNMMMQNELSRQQ
jgi:hypothetical protein